MLDSGGGAGGAQHTVIQTHDGAPGLQQAPGDTHPPPGSTHGYLPPIGGRDASSSPGLGYDLSRRRYSSHAYLDPSVGGTSPEPPPALGLDLSTRRFSNHGWSSPAGLHNTTTHGYLPPIAGRGATTLTPNIGGHDRRRRHSHPACLQPSLLAPPLADPGGLAPPGQGYDLSKRRYSGQACPLPGILAATEGVPGRLAPTISITGPQTLRQGPTGVHSIYITDQPTVKL